LKYFIIKITKITVNEEIYEFLNSMLVRNRKSYEVDLKFNVCKKVVAQLRSVSVCSETVVQGA